MYKVIKDFFDLQDGDTFYQVGEIYPKTGHNPTEARIQGLLTKNNGLRTPLIEEVEPERPEPKEEPAEEIKEEPIEEVKEEKEVKKPAKKKTEKKK